MSATDSNGYEITQNLPAWSAEDLIRTAYDTELTMGLEKYQVVKIALELAERLDNLLEAVYGLYEEYGIEDDEDAETPD